MKLAATARAGTRACLCCHDLAGVIGVDACDECRAFTEVQAAAREDLERAKREYERHEEEILAAHLALHRRKQAAPLDLDLPDIEVPVAEVLAASQPKVYAPSVPERILMQRRPELADLVLVAPALRELCRVEEGMDAEARSAADARLAWLVQRYPHIRDDETWATLLRG